MTQEQPYTVMRKIGDLEIRDYPASAHAQLTLSSNKIAMPQPTNSDLIIREAPAHLAGATIWSGSWKYSEVQKRGEEMQKQLIDLSYRVSGEPRRARYDPPWKPWFLRRNEVIVPIVEA